MKPGCLYGNNFLKMIDVADIKSDHTQIGAVQFGNFVIVQTVCCQIDECRIDITATI